MWTQDDIPDLSGRVAVVTGANGGLGLATTEALAARGAHVVMAVRNQTKAEAARDQLKAGIPGASLEIIELDLGNQASVKQAATAIAAAHPTVDLLVNNAGLMAMPERQTDDGYEMQFGVNHLGHWTFTAGLLPNLLRAARARVVTVTSIARFQGDSVDPDNPHLRGNYEAWAAYGQAKLANYHFGLGLHDRFRAAGVSAMSLLAHPGMSNTDLQANTVDEGGGGWRGPFFHTLARRVGMTPDVGARPQLRAATDPTARSGQLYGPLFGTNGPAVRRPVLGRDDEAIDTLWRVSERETGVILDVDVAGVGGN
jgi:NAD(P)-dependent dehydrogenase (short-subunit alcohol dehydrogenase family)